MVGGDTGYTTQDKQEDVIGSSKDDNVRPSPISPSINPPKQSSQNGMSFWMKLNPNYISKHHRML